MVKIKCSKKGCKVKFQGSSEECMGQIDNLIVVLARKNPVLLFPIFDGLAQVCDKEQLHAYVDYMAPDAGKILWAYPE